jgi:hypothetical protein
MVIIPHLPYSPDIALCDFTLFPKLKMKLKGRRLETVSDNQREPQAPLDSIKENDFHGAFVAREKTMESLYTFQRRQFLRRWQPKLSNLSQHFFLYLVRELSDTPRIFSLTDLFSFKKVLTAEEMRSRLKGIEGATKTVGIPAKIRTRYLPYIPYFEKIKVGVCHHNAVCLCITLSNSEPMNISL